MITCVTGTKKSNDIGIMVW